mgnify:CR=1 FL=1
MFNLVLKDISITKKTYPVVLILCFTNNMFFINAPIFIYIIVPPLIAYEYFKNSCENDYKYNSNIMFSSLPVSRREVVFSKYIESMLFLIFAVICTIGFTFVFRHIGLSGLGGGTFIHLSKLMHLDDFSKLINFKSIIMYSILSTILFISIYFPIYFPIYFKLEYLKVRNIFALVSILICFVPILVLYFMGSENVYNIVKYFRNIPGIIASVALICIFFVILYISVNISIKYYENKDLIS